MSSDNNGPWAFVDRPARPPNHALADDATAAVLDEAILTLIRLRSLEWGDGLAALHALTSLAVQLQLRLPDAVTDAVDQGYAWTEIADQLGVTPAAARRHGHNFRVVPLAD